VQVVAVKRQTLPLQVALVLIDRRDLHNKQLTR